MPPPQKRPAYSNRPDRPEVVGMIFQASDGRYFITTDGDPLLLDGRAIPRDAFPGLFAAIKTTYGGAGDTFNVPDLRANNRTEAT